ncbi:MAG: methionine adenosyltransferase [Planctomycetota bacterium]|jgi:S-adenosylmethionine synthetase|nr:methionine adenosyltransferase [Planctomycetota bacterium]
MAERSLFTSESVTMGHPDKVSDQISDAILDDLLSQDPNSRVAVETLVTTGLALIAGEITTQGYCDFDKVARQTIEEIGYTNTDMGFHYEDVAVLSAIHGQSGDIAQGVDEGKGLHSDQGAGDQGMMFGFACNETPEYMPLPILLARKLVDELANARETSEMYFLRPDGKSQVTVEYVDGAPARVDTIVISTQHTPEADLEKDIKPKIIDELIRKVVPGELLDENTIFHVNPTGNFVKGGPAADTGLTGRKIIVDTYGGRGRHGGGAFSGKDPSKVDRSAAYMARYIAKNIVAAGLADICEVQLSYAIGVAEPCSVLVDTQGTGKKPEVEIAKLVRQHFPLTPKEIIKTLNLRRPIYLDTARKGHFGRPDLPWEQTDKVDDLR